jgi:hypothetical protein
MPRSAELAAPDRVASSRVHSEDRREAPGTYLTKFLIFKMFFHVYRAPLPFMKWRKVVTA